MAKFGAKESALAKVYAAAIFQVAEAAGKVDALAEELGGLAEVVKRDPEFRSFLDSPIVGVGARALTIEKLFRGKYDDVLVDSLQILNRNERLGLIDEVAREYHAQQEEWKGRLEVEAETATPLSDALRLRLQGALSRTTGKQVDLIERVDESLIGGLIVRIGDDKFDNSVRRKLATIARALLERASRELHGGKTYTVGTAGR